MPSRTPDPATMDEATVQAALTGLDTDLTHLREQTRQADAKAGTVLTVVGLILAAATAVLPRLNGAALAVAVIALMLVVASGPLLGAAVMPRLGRGRGRRPTADDILAIALERVREPHDLLPRRAEEVSVLIAVSSRKHHLVRAALLLLGFAFVVAVVAATLAAATALA